LDELAAEIVIGIVPSEPVIVFSEPVHELASEVFELQGTARTAGEARRAQSSSCGGFSPLDSDWLSEPSPSWLSTGFLMTRFCTTG